MARYAIVSGTEVVNVVVWNGPGKRPTRYQHSRWPSRSRPVTPQLPDPAFRGQAIELDPDQQCGPGWRFEDNVFIPPGWTYEDGEFIPPPDE